MVSATCLYCKSQGARFAIVQHADFSDFFVEYPLQEVAAYMRNLCMACESIHQIGLIHRDIKPGNFYWNPSTRKGVLVDFGLAQVSNVLLRNQDS